MAVCAGIIAGVPSDIPTLSRVAGIDVDMMRTQALTITLLLLALGIQLDPLGTAEAALPSYDRVRVLQTARSISDVELTDQDGRSFKLSQLNGNISFVFFGFTNCPDVCPMTMRLFQQLHESGKVESEQVQFILVSVDGERDSPDVLKAYLKQFSPDIIGLTGDPAAVKSIAKEFRASFYKGNSPANGEGYSMMHSPQAFLLDQDGSLRAELYSPTIEAMAGLANALLEETASDTD